MSKKSKSKFVFTDIHGNFDTFMALIDKVAAEGGYTRQYVIANMVVCGDLEDRGPKSAQIIQFCIENNIPVVMGNHEAMMLDHATQSASYYMKQGHFDGFCWTEGALETMESYLYKEENGAGIEETKLNFKMLLDHLAWMRTLPLYIEFPDVFNEEGRYLVISHSQIHNVWNTRDSVERAKELESEYIRISNGFDIKERAEWKKTEQHNELRKKLSKASDKAVAFSKNILWARPYKIKDAGGIYNVHGHTPQQDGPRIRKIYSCVDTGCFYNGERGYDQLSCLQFPEMKVTIHKNIDREKIVRGVYE